MGQLQEGFNRFMVLSHPTVMRGTQQWATMELVWHSSALVTTKVLIERGNDEEVAMDLMQESVDYCKTSIKIMRARQVNDFN